MRKEVYVEAILVIINFDDEDIITTSGMDDGWHFDDDVIET